MKATNAIKRQQRKLFIGEIISFAIIFTVLGFIIYALFQNAIYSNVDRSIEIQKEQILTNTIPDLPDPTGTSNQSSFNSSNNPPQNRTQNPGAGSPFQTETLIFAKDGTISNQDTIGQRNYQLLQQIKLDKSKKNKLVDLTVSTGNNLTSSFRTELIYVPTSNENAEYAGKYVIILANVDSEIMAIHSFQIVFLITLAIFAVLAVIVSYYLSRRSMQPIIKAWNRQQEFSADAAHELRTPLTVIQNNLEYLLTKPNAKIIDETESISNGLDETRRLKKLTESLLMLSRSDSNVLQLNVEETDVKTFFNNLITPYVEIASSQDKSLRIENNFNGSAQLDGGLIKQLSVILLDNALKYTPAGGTIVVTVAQVGTDLNLTVTDTGIGITDKDKENIFERFYRADNSRTQKTGGNGLGLSIAKWITEQHQGTITVTDNHPTGAKFIVKIPVK